MKSLMSFKTEYGTEVLFDQKGVPNKHILKLIYRASIISWNMKPLFAKKTAFHQIQKSRSEHIITNKQKRCRIYRKHSIYRKNYPLLTSQLEIVMCCMYDFPRTLKSSQRSVAYYDSGHSGFHFPFICHSQLHKLLLYTPSFVASHSQPPQL